MNKQMDLFDSLPKEVRILIAAANVNIDMAGLRYYLRDSITDPEAVRAYIDRIERKRQT